MKVVALVSGGKDSTYNMLHCVIQGHEIVAMANLHPPVDSASDEMDSFMYQTVGYTALSKYSECMGRADGSNVPMYRRAIKGTSAIQSLDYKPTEKSDETEDLFELLQDVLREHPDVQGVSVGAILSTYQRTRVENVCQRLGLTSLAYLWERSQAELLDEIIASGVDARIIKTAAYGLGVRHLGKSLGEIRAELVKMNRMFGLHLCGEGGEYETLVVDSPLFTRKLEPQSQSVVGSSKDEVYHLTFGDFDTVEKTDGAFGIDNLEGWKDDIKVPELLEPEFQDILDMLEGNKLQDSISIGSLSVNEFGPAEIKQTRSSNAVYNLTAPSEFKNKSIEEEATALFALLTEFETTNNIASTSQYTSASLVLSSMSDFAAVNAIYNKHFTEPLPPARVCIESSNIINNMRLQLSLTFIDPGQTKMGIHVQGRSYWTPANIGPYSQATRAHGIAHFAGQIPLIPASMDLVPADNIPLQAVLSLQHIHRVRRALSGVGEFFAYIAAVVSSESAGAVARQAWAEYKDTSGVETPMFVVRVNGLPRAAAVEWTGLGIDQIMLDSFDLDDDETYIQTPEFDGTRCEFGKQIVNLTYAESGTSTTAKPEHNAAVQHVQGTLYVTSQGYARGMEWYNVYEGQLELVLVDSLEREDGQPLDLVLVTRGLKK